MLCPLSFVNLFSSLSFILACCTPYRSGTSGLQRPSPLACAERHAAAFAVNAALVASRWQHAGGESMNRFLAPTHQRRARDWTGRNYRFSSLNSV